MAQIKKPSRHIPKYVKEAVRQRDGRHCRICGNASEYMEFDHITPYSKGAPSTIENIQLICRKCNLAKRDKTPKCQDCQNWIPYEATFCQHCGNPQKIVKSKNSDEFFDSGMLIEIGRLILLGIAVLMIVGGVISIYFKLRKYF